LQLENLGSNFNDWEIPVWVLGDGCWLICWVIIRLTYPKDG
jgi:hypothetical protein